MVFCKKINVTYLINSQGGKADQEHETDAFEVQDNGDLVLYRVEKSDLVTRYPTRVIAAGYWKEFTVQY